MCGDVEIAMITNCNNNNNDEQQTNKQQQQQQQQNYNEQKTKNHTLSHYL